MSRRWMAAAVLVLGTLVPGAVEAGDCGPREPAQLSPGYVGPDGRMLPHLPAPEVPDRSLRYVHDYYVGRYRTRDPVKGREDLRFWVLTAAPAQFEPNRQHAVENDWNARFLKDLDVMLGWYRDLRAGDPKRVYDLGKAYQAGAVSETTEGIGELLIGMAHDLGFPPATFEVALQWLNSDDASWHSAGGELLRNAAFCGHVPALVEIVARLREGRGFERDDVETYYWLLRSRPAGLQVDAAIRDLESRLGEPQRRKAQGWLTLDHYPRRWERED